MNNYWTDAEAIATWTGHDPDDYYTTSGARREPPAVCYTCGADVPDGPRFGREAMCDDCARAGRGPVTPWLAGEETR